MQISITARHLALTPSLGDYVRKKLEKVGRHYPGLLRAQAILIVEKLLHIVEIVVHSSDRHDFRVEARSSDMYAAIDIAVDKLNKHLMHQKDKLVLGTRRKSRLLARRIRTSPSSSPMPPVLPLEEGMTGSDDESSPVAEVKPFVPESMTVRDAVDEMDRLGYNFYVFSNEEKKGRLHIVYRRSDGTCALLFPKA
ncbi:MAG TPA: ribosome-associated translation inhibitor RaiA [Elusimicrobiota bacterium]|nr:ribosome-associated translation inhibitor RaiA [Elusimicrobiota bacterium]